MSTNTIIVLIMFAVIVIVLVKELLPIGVVGLAIPLFLVAFNLMSTEEVMSYFVNETVVLIACVYVMSEALTEVGIADKIGKSLIHTINRVSGANAKKTESIAILLIILGAAVSSLILPRYGVTGAFMAVCISVARSTRVSRTKLLLVLAMAANIWGNNTLMSTPPNMLANGVLEESGATAFGFFEFSLIGVPLGFVGSLLLFIFKDKTLACNYDENTNTEQNESKNEVEKEKMPRWRVMATATVFLAFFLLIVLEDTIGIPGHVTGIFCIAVLIALKLMSEKKVCSSIDWGMPAFFGGILAFGTAMEVSGASELIATGIVRVIGDSPNPFFICGVLFTAAAILTQFISNTGAAGLLFPIAMALATKLNADPRAVIMAVTMGCGASFMTPMATVSNIMVVASGEIKFMDFVKAGTPLIIAMIAMCTFLIPIIWPFW